MTALLEVTDLELFYGDAQVLASVSVQIPQGGIVAIVGATARESRR